MMAADIYITQVNVLPAPGTDLKHFTLRRPYSLGTCTVTFT